MGFSKIRPLIMLMMTAHYLFSLLTYNFTITYGRYPISCCYIHSVVLYDLMIVWQCGMICILHGFSCEMDFLTECPNPTQVAL